MGRIGLSKVLIPLTAERVKFADIAARLREPLLCLTNALIDCRVERGRLEPSGETR